MVGKFAHSFDRETFVGSEPTRQDALARASERVPQLDNAPDMIYIGKRVPIDPGSAGLAEMILGAMRRRFREATGEHSNQHLTRVNEHQLAELDEEIDRVVRAWMTKHGLNSTASKIVAISEHPVPQPKMTAGAKNKSSNGEVSDLGDSEYPFSLS